jgi:hypothetical protein
VERAAELTTGLVRDDENHYSQRLVLWEEFNTCWLATLQKQKAFTQPPITLIDYDFLEKMGTQLVKHCDNMEKHGLVDYQMGVWEEEIIASRCSSMMCRRSIANRCIVLTSCLDLLEEVGAGSSAQRPTSTARRR